MEDEEEKDTNECLRCGKEFDPSYDFVEEVELLESLVRYVDIESFCPDCLHEIDEHVEKSIKEFLKEEE